MGKLVIILAFLLCGCFPAHKTPHELAAWAKCKPDMIASWQSATIDYQEQFGYPPADVIMARKWGDCKGYAAIASETLTDCGIDNRIILLTQKRGPDHVINVFTLKDGRRGFVNRGQSKIYPSNTDWRDIITDVSGGPWTAEFVGE